MLFPLKASVLGRLRPRTWSAPYQYLFAVVASLVALGLSLALRFATDRVPLAIFLTAVMASAWLGGLRPALLAAVMSGLAIAFFFFPPYQTVVISEPEDFLWLGMFLLTALVIGSLSASQRLARREAEEASQRLAFLAHASRELAHSLDHSATLATAARLAVPTLADWCIAYAVEDGSIHRSELACDDPSIEKRLRYLHQQYPVRADAPEGVASVVRTGQPRIIGDVRRGFLRELTNDPEHLAMLEAVHLRAYAIIPLVARDRTIGALAFASATPDCFQGQHLALMEELARRAAQALDNARLYSRLQETLRTRDEFLASAAHDLRNPLTSIRAAVQLLERRISRLEIPEADRLSSTLASVDATAGKMAELISQFLDVARMEMGQPLALDPKPTDLVGLAREVAAQQVHASERHEIHLEAQVEELRGMWDTVRIGRVIDNLIANALKYSPEGGKVTISIREEAGWAVLQVEDEGVGIPESELGSIFERFRRGSNVVGKIGGTGVGLAGARQIVEQHAGTISASNRQGPGAVFTVRLPLSSDESDETHTGS